MTLAAVIVGTVDANVTYDASQATDQSFKVGITQKGPLTPVRSFSLPSWVKTWGVRVGNSSSYDAARLYFEEGGKALVQQRVVGPAPVLASSTASNAVPATVIKLSAASYGSYANAFTRQFVVGESSGVQLILIDENGVKVQSGDLTTQAEIVAFAATSGFVTAAALMGSGLPVVDAEPVAFASGTDDSTDVTDDQKQTALDVLKDPRLGPGQVEITGATTDAAHLMIQAHCDPITGMDRIGLLEFADSADAGTIAGIASDLHTGVGSGASFGIAPWVITPDVFDVPPASFFSAKLAASDLATGDPNQPAAGSNGQASWITGLTQDWTDPDRLILDDAGINVIRDVDGQGTLQIQGYSTFSTNPLLIALSNARLDMLIRWRARAEFTPLQYQEVDSKGILVSRYHSALDSMMTLLGPAVFGYLIDTVSVNNADTAALQQVNARIGIQRTQYSKVVNLDITNYAVNQTLGA